MNNDKYLEKKEMVKITQKPVAKPEQIFWALTDILVVLKVCL